MGTGSANITVEFWRFNECECRWDYSRSSYTIDAEPNSQTQCGACKEGCSSSIHENCPPQTVAQTGLQNTEINVFSGRGDPLGLPEIITIHDNGDPEVRLPGDPDALIFDPIPGYLDGWILGGARYPRRTEEVTLTNTIDEITYVFEFVAPGEPLPLIRKKRSDGTVISSYEYAVDGKLERIYNGDASSNTYFELLYTGDSLESITPYIDGIADSGRGIELVYYSDQVIGVEQGGCSSCGFSDRRYYYDAEGRLAQIRNTDGQLLERFTYVNDRLTQHERLNQDNVLVVIETREFVDNPDNTVTVTVREALSGVEERIRIETFDSSGVLIQQDEYVELFAPGSPPSGEDLTTTYSLTREEDSGVTTITREVVEPSGLVQRLVTEYHDDGTRQVVQSTIGRDASPGPTTTLVSTFSALTNSYLDDYRIDERGGRTDYVHNSQGLLECETGPTVTLLDGGGQVRSVTRYEYDSQDRLIRIGHCRSSGCACDGDPGDFVWTEYTYDEYDRILTMTENADGPAGPERPVTEYHYNAYGDQTQVIDPRNVCTETIYDDAGWISDKVVYDGFTGNCSGNVLSQTHYEYDDNGRLERVQVAYDTEPFTMGAPADGWSETSYTLDLFGRRTAVQVPGPEDGSGPLETQYTYDWQEQVIQVDAPNGATQTTSRDGLGRVIAQTITGTDVPAITTTQVYDTEIPGTPYQTIQPSGNTTTYHYDNFVRPSETENAARRVFTYDDAGQVTRALVTDRNDRNDILSDTLTDYDELGRTIRTHREISDTAEDSVDLVVYNPAGFTSASIAKGDGNSDLDAAESGDRVTRYEYDPLGRRTQTTIENSAPNPNSVTAFTYDEGGNMLTQTVDPGGLAIQTSYIYDPLSRLERSTDPAGHYREYMYDSQSNEIRETAHHSDLTPLSQTRHEYDLGGRRTRTARMANASSGNAVNAAVDAVSDHTYYDTGQLETVTTYAGSAPIVSRVTTYEYDGIGRRTRTILPEDSAHNWTEIIYEDGTGRVELRRVSDPLGVREFDYAYDAFDRLQIGTALGGNGEPDLVTTYTLDGLGRQLDINHPDNTFTHRVYDMRGRMTDLYEDNTGLNRRTESRYDRLGRLVTLIAHDSDGPQQETDYGYDLLGRRTLLRFPDHIPGSVPGDPGYGEIHYHYDAAGRLTQQDDQRGFSIEYPDYDPRGLKTQRLVKDPGFDVNDTFEYDGLGRMTLARRNSDNNRVEWTYTDLGYLDYEDQTIFGVTKRVDYAHNQLGEKTRMTLPNAGATLVYRYDMLGQNTEIHRDGSLLVEYDYDGRYPSGRRLHTGQAQIDIGWAYDHHRRIIGINNDRIGAGGPCDLSCYTFDHDLMGNPTYSHMSGQASVDWNVDYEYDDLQRLEVATYTGSVSGDEVFNMDVLGNRVSYSDTRPGSTEIVSYTHNLVNEYQTINGMQVLHDAAGNLTHDDQGFGYSYDFENRLVRVFTDTDSDGEYDPGEEIFARYHLRRHGPADGHHHGWRDNGLLLRRSECAGRICPAERSPSIFHSWHDLHR